MVVVVALSRQDPWVGVQLLTQQGCEALAPAEELLQRLSPAKDEG